MDRRTFLRGTGAVGSALALSALLPGRAGATAGSYFLHGVASGDPMADSVILWTRVTPTADALPGSGVGPKVDVAYEVAEDAQFRKIVTKGSYETSNAIDHTVKVEARGLKPDKFYWFRFRFDGTTSPVGRTRTAPAPSFLASQLNFGLVTCSNFEGGYFSAYRHLAAQADSLHAVLHLGDYIYEYEVGKYGPGPTYGRTHSPEVATYSLRDYRMRHAQYKMDPDLQALHAVVPFITTWDDHEVADEMWSGGTLDTPPNMFQSRKAAAHRAYAEWMPIRFDGSEPIYRSLNYGRLVDISMLDLRTFRDETLPRMQEDKASKPGRTLTGPEQFKWLTSELSGSEARWKLLGNPVMVSPLMAPTLPSWMYTPLSQMFPGFPEQGRALNLAQWDGYAHERNVLLNHLIDNKINNTAFLTGDIHMSFGGAVPLDFKKFPNTPKPAVEFVVPALTSDSLGDVTGNFVSSAVKPLLQMKNTNFNYMNLNDHGYSILNVTPDSMSCSWYMIDDRANLKSGIKKAKTLSLPYSKTAEIGKIS